MDDKDTLRENLKAIYRSLPEQVKIAIFSPETSDAYDRVKVRYLLNDEQRETLSVQSGLLMMGLRLPQELVTALTEGLNIPREQASLIAQELNRDIFNAIRDDLKQIHQPEQSTPVTPPTTATTPPPPPKPLDPLYPSFLQQIKENTSPYISGAFPDAQPQPKDKVTTPPVVPTPSTPRASTSIPAALVQPVSAVTPPTNTSLPASVITTPQAVIPPPVTPVLPVTPTATITPPAKSLEEIQASIQNLVAPQAIQAVFQGKAAEIDQSKLPTTGAPFMQREVILSPARETPQTNAAPQATPVPEAPTPPPTSIFEQKMSGAFTIKSDAPNYSAPATPVLATPQPQAPATLTMPQVPPAQNPIAAAQGDAYREPTA